MTERQRELKAAYKVMKKPMGVYVYECLATGKKYVGTTNDLRGTMNGTTFKLNMGMFPCKNLWKDWRQYGEAGFKSYILQELPYDEKDAEKTDYKDDLIILRMILTEKMDHFELL